MSSVDRPHLPGHEQEAREGKVIGARALLEEKIIPDLHKDEANYRVPKKLADKLTAIQSKGTRLAPNKPGEFEEVYWITYNTETGEMGYPDKI